MRFYYIASTCVRKLFQVFKNRYTKKDIFWVHEQRKIGNLTEISWLWNLDQNLMIFKIHGNSRLISASNFFFCKNLFIQKQHFTGFQYNSQKQQPDVFYKNNCSLKFCNIYRKASVLECLFEKVAGLKARNFIKKRLQYRNFPVNITEFSRTPILKNICQ